MDSNNMLIFKNIIKRLSIIIISVILLLSVGLFLYFSGYMRFNYPDREKYPVRGIDVSHHQGNIDWQLLKTEKVTFAYIKATEGGDFKDTCFHTNWKKASEAGIVRGAYHFFTFCRPGSEQAANFIQSVPVEADALPPVIDFEFVGNCSYRPAKEALLQDVRAFVELIELTYGQKPVFYVNYDSYDEYLDGAIEGYSIWIRDIFWHPTLNRDRDWTFWQYADNARLRGIKGPVDLNVFNGTLEELIELLRR